MRELQLSIGAPPARRVPALIWAGGALLVLSTILIWTPARQRVVRAFLHSDDEATLACRQESRRLISDLCQRRGNAQTIADCRERLLDAVDRGEDGRCAEQLVVLQRARSVASTASHL